MKIHIENLKKYIPNFELQKILDLGSGRGRFLIELAKDGINAIGLEMNPEYIAISMNEARRNNVSIHVDSGVGEKLPHPDNFFSFINVCEVIEHVNNPDAVMSEVYRVLVLNGSVYVSVPNRFGMKDQHFNLYFVNWLPRIFSDCFISVFGKHKTYTTEAGFQRLKDMHYYTFSKAKKFFESYGFEVFDIREIKIKNKIKNIFAQKLAMLFYRFFRIFYFDSFHFLLKKR